jgi:hypothetical protein
MSFITEFQRALDHEGFRNIHAKIGTMYGLVSFKDEFGQVFDVVVRDAGDAFAHSAHIASFLVSALGKTFDLVDADQDGGLRTTTFSLNVDGSFGLLGEDENGDLGMSLRDYVSSGLETLQNKRILPRAVSTK